MSGKLFLPMAGAEEGTYSLGGVSKFSHGMANLRICHGVVSNFSLGSILHRYF